MDAALKELNPGRYKRLIELVIGQESPFALCDSFPNQLSFIRHDFKYCFTCLKTSGCSFRFS